MFLNAFKRIILNAPLKQRFILIYPLSIFALSGWGSVLSTGLRQCIQKGDAERCFTIFLG